MAQSEDLSDAELVFLKALWKLSGSYKNPHTLTLTTEGGSITIVHHPKQKDPIPLTGDSNE